MSGPFGRWRAAWVPGAAAEGATEPVLVVDFGTTTSAAMLVADGMVRPVYEPGSGLWAWPSAVCVDGETVLVGSSADNRRRVDPAAYRTEFKRDLGETAPIQLGDKSFRPEELVTELLVAIRAQAVKLMGRPIERLLLTVPASYGPADPRPGLMIAAGEQAGFVEVELLPEPVAAAYAPLQGAPFRVGETVLVYDFGGGTFDAALVRIAKSGDHEVLGHAALDDCGGRDVDAALFRLIRDRGGPTLEHLLAQPTLAVDTRRDVVQLSKLVKHQLTDGFVARDRYAPAQLDVTVDRPAFGALAYPILERTITCCQELLARSNVALGQVSAVLLVGGSSRMPIVTEAVSVRLGRPIRYAEDPTTAVVSGTARWTLAGRARLLAPAAAPANEKPLSWVLPGGSATVVRWLVAPGSSYAAGTPLLSVRLPSGEVLRLSDDRPGKLLHTRVSDGDSVVSGDWLAVVRPDQAVAGSAAAGGAPPSSPVAGAAPSTKARGLTIAAVLLVTGIGYLAGISTGEDGEDWAVFFLFVGSLTVAGWIGWWLSRSLRSVLPWVPIVGGLLIGFLLPLAMVPVLEGLNYRVPTYGKYGDSYYRPSYISRDDELYVWLILAGAVVWLSLPFPWLRSTANRARLAKLFRR
ncbi:Hsp70 family protein [Nocardioides sp.]|uniref:Hsp70 family protein n=1 Tax=Nocardioides sp. TaxID=35761 RepID=UPI003D13A34E